VGPILSPRARPEGALGEASRMEHAGIRAQQLLVLA
jgi:hypothetical protein